MKQSIMLEKNLQEEQITYEDSPEPSGLRLLVVDENETALEIFRKNLRELGVQSEIVAMSDEFLQKLRSANGDKASPYEIVERMIRREPGLTAQPRILLCEAVGPEAAIPGTLSKPFTPSASSRVSSI